MQHQDDVPSPSGPPEGYTTRDLRPGDEPAWAALLHASGELGPWDLQRLALETAALVPGTQVFAARGPQLVAGAGVYQRDADSWEIGWIATHPDHRRLGLGSHVTAQALRRAAGLAPRPIRLLTEDHRLAAVRLYLRLGFRPLCQHRSHRRRWRAVAAQLDPPWSDIVVSFLERRTDDAAPQ